MYTLPVGSYIAIRLYTFVPHSCDGGATPLFSFAITWRTRWQRTEAGLALR